MRALSISALFFALLAVACGAKSDPVDEAIKTLSTLDSAKVVETTTRLAADTRGWAEGAYDKLKKPLWDAFRKAVDRGDLRVAENIARLFERGDWSGLARDFVGAAEDTGIPAKVRETALEALGRLPDAVLKAQRTHIGKAVIGALEDANAVVVASAARLAGKLDLKEATEALKSVGERLKDGAVDTGKAAVRDVADALKKLGDETSAKELLEGVVDGAGKLLDAAKDLLDL